MKNEANGFTLIEMLLVISLLSIFILLAIPIQQSISYSEQDERFLEILQYDVLHIQNLARTTRENVLIRFNPNHYVVLQSGKKLYERTLPEHWNIKINNIQDISFTIRGTIRESGNISINTAHAVYKFICPLGKGRCYIEKK